MLRAGSVKAISTVIEELVPSISEGFISEFASLLATPSAHSFGWQ